MERTKDDERALLSEYIPSPGLFLWIVFAPGVSASFSDGTTIETASEEEEEEEEEEEGGGDGGRGVSKKSMMDIPSDLALRDGEEEDGGKIWRWPFPDSNEP